MWLTKVYDLTALRVLFKGTGRLYLDAINDANQVIPLLRLVCFQKNYNIILLLTHAEPLKLCDTVRKSDQ